MENKQLHQQNQRNPPEQTMNKIQIEHDILVFEFAGKCRFEFVFSVVTDSQARQSADPQNGLK
jgi:hypothetical protein